MSTKGDGMSKDEVESTSDGIANFIVERAKEEWERFKRPYYLSNVSPELMLRNVNYKDVLGAGTSLKQFVGSLSCRVQLVSHPIHKAKVAAVPVDSGFSFEAEPAVATSQADEKPKRFRQNSQRYAVLQFLTALSHLTDEEQKSVVIPVHILAKLMGEK